MDKYIYIYNQDNLSPVVDDATHKKWLSYLKKSKILYLHGMYGCGKTSQAIHFAKKYFKNWDYFSASNESFSEKSEEFILSYKKSSGKILLILDDIQWITNPEEKSFLFSSLLKYTPTHIQIILIGNSNLPEFLVPLRITQQLVVIDKNCFILDKNQIRELFESQEELKSISSIKKYEFATKCFDLTRGSMLFIQIMLQRACEYYFDENTCKALSFKDVCYQLDTQLFNKWSEQDKSSLIRLGMFESFNLEMAQLVLGESAEDFITKIMQLDSFLQFEAPNKYTFHPMFTKYFLYKASKLPDQLLVELYTLVANYYEKQRNFEKALYYYKQINRTDKITEIVVYLLENGDGCIFAKLSEEYIHLIPVEEEQKPSVIGAKAMLAAYKMKPEESSYYLSKLKSLITENGKVDLSSKAVSSYIRTFIASPCVSSDTLHENLILCGKYVSKNGVALNHIMPTSNSASIINGGIDLLFWIPKKSLIFPIMKPIILSSLGVEGVGAPDAAFGEVLYEQNKRIQAMGSLTQALSDANFKGSIRVQYAITGIMARVLESDGQLEASQDILMNIFEKAKLENFNELLPNISASLVTGYLLKNDSEKINAWLENESPNEHGTFYITSRYRLLAKARVYVSIGRELEALHIVNMLENYAILYHRHYLQIELLILKSIIFFRKNEDWQPLLIEALNKAQPYKIIRIFADQGSALFPLFKQLDNNLCQNINHKYIKEIIDELSKMATYYPKYLEIKPVFEALTQRELQVLELIAKGYSNSKISQELNVNIGTTKFHVSNIMKKLHAKNRTVVVKIAHENKLI